MFMYGLVGVFLCVCFSLYLQESIREILESDVLASWDGSLATISVVGSLVLAADEAVRHRHVKADLDLKGRRKDATRSSVHVLSSADTAPPSPPST